MRSFHWLSWSRASSRPSFLKRKADGGYNCRITTSLSIILVLLLVQLVPISSWAEDHPVDLTELSLEDLFNIEVTSVSKKPEKLSDAAAAVFVISQEDLRRSGVTSVADALRMVPGLQVASIDANKWAISSRGFNGRFANKMLVLVDGQSMYTHIWSGVFWNQLMPCLDNIERIEVIRGPGGSLWGANAVNGIINVITKNAKDTRGSRIHAGFGTEERGFGDICYGGMIGEQAWFRTYVKYSDRDSYVDSAGSVAFDDWRYVRGGFRVDWNKSDRDAITVLGDVEHQNSSQTYQIITSMEYPYRETFDFSTEQNMINMLGRWKHSYSESSDLAAQVYYAWHDCPDVTSHFRDNVVDVDFQHRITISQVQEIIWGAGYRRTNDIIKGSFTLSHDPEKWTDHLLSAFIQDNFRLAQDRVHLTIGSKIEHSSHSGVELQPNVRLMWKPHRYHSLWAAIARAVRTPSRVESAIRLVQEAYPPGALSPGSPTTLVIAMGNPDFGPEEVIAYELGYRVCPTSDISADLALFYNVYDDLRQLCYGTAYLTDTPAPPHLVIPVYVKNQAEGETYGAELGLFLQPKDWWRLKVSYSYLHTDVHSKSGIEDPGIENLDGESPRHAAYLRSSFDLTRNLEFDATANYVHDLPALNVDAHTTVNLRLGWRVNRSIELSLVGQNLLEGSHGEFTPDYLETIPTQVQRSFYGVIRWSY